MRNFLSEQTNIQLKHKIQALGGYWGKQNNIWSLFTSTIDSSPSPNSLKKATMIESIGMFIKQMFLILRPLGISIEYLQKLVLELK